MWSFANRCCWKGEGGTSSWSGIISFAFSCPCCTVPGAVCGDIQQCCVSDAHLVLQQTCSSSIGLVTPQHPSSCGHHTLKASHWQQYSTLFEHLFNRCRGPEAHQPQVFCTLGYCLLFICYSGPALTWENQRMSPLSSWLQPHCSNEFWYPGLELQGFPSSDTLAQP